MTSDQAENIVSMSALVVGGTYLYRKLIEPSVPATASTGRHNVAQAMGYGPPLSVGKFVTGWGFTFLMISMIAQVSPDLGSSMAILVAVATLLINGAAIAVDVNHRLSGA